MPSAAENLAEATRLYRAGDREGARDLCERLVAAEPDNADALNLRGLIDHRAGAHAAAADWIGRALEIEPENAVFHFNLGETLRAREKIDEAMAAYYRALGFDPTLAGAYTNIGLLCLERRRLPEAADVLRRATACMPTDGAAYARLGAAQAERGELDAALAAFAQAIRFEPGNHSHVHLFLRTLDTYPFPSLPPEVVRELRTCFDLDDIEHQKLVPAAVAVLKRDERFAGLLAMTDGEDIVAIMAATAGGVFDDLLSEPLLLGLLVNTIVTDDEMVRVLSTVRRAIVLQGEQGTAPEDFVVGRRRQFVIALALQCFATDYAWHETPREALAAGYMLSEVRRGLDAIGDASEASAWDLEMWNRLAVVATYRPIRRIEGIEKLLGLGLPAEAPYRRMLIRRQVAEPLRERELATTMTRVAGPSPESDGNEAERPPYPRWHRLARVEPGNYADGLERLIPGFVAPEYARGAMRVLVAGCSTGKRALRLATAYDNVEILATDPNLDNLAYAARVATETGVGNIAFRQVPRGELGRIDERFHIVHTGSTMLRTDDATGPWRALADRLLPDGLMHVEARVGRIPEALMAARRLVHERSLVGDAEGVREARKLLLDLPDGEPARGVVAADGFHNLHQCRDLLFPDGEEAPFTVADLRDALPDLGLRFLAYEARKQATMKDFLELFGDSANPGNPDQWAELEERRPGSLGDTHRIWCRKAQ